MEGESRIWVLRSIPSSDTEKIPAELVPISPRRELKIRTNGDWIASTHPLVTAYAVSHGIQVVAPDTVRIQQGERAPHYLTREAMPARVTVGPSSYDIGVDFDRFVDHLGMVYVHMMPYRGQMVDTRVAYLTRWVGMGITSEGRRILYPEEHAPQMRRLMDMQAIEYTVSADHYALYGADNPQSASFRLSGGDQYR